MIKSEVILVNKLGLHARASAALVKLASTFDATITIEYGDKTADGKSIMSVMMLAAAVGSKLQISIFGEDEQAAMKAISDLIADQFGEGE